MKIVFLLCECNVSALTYCSPQSNAKVHLKKGFYVTSDSRDDAQRSWLSITGEEIFLTSCKDRKHQCVEAHKEMKCIQTEPSHKFILKKQKLQLTHFMTVTLLNPV